MMTHRILTVILACCCCMGSVFAAPEPVAKETKGQITGQITEKDGGKITVKGVDSQLTLIPHWRGGLPKDGGGFDKDMLKQLEAFKVGDAVKVTWSLDEHYRIEKIEAVEAPALPVPDPATAKPKDHPAH